MLTKPYHRSVLLRLSLTFGKSRGAFMSVQDLIPLQMVCSGRFGRIEELFGDASHVHRLEEMGLRRGAEFQVVQSGTPCIVLIGGTKLCIRAADLYGVLVRPEVTG